MAIEYEAKILDIDPDAIYQLILDRGGHSTTETRLMRRYVYDIDPADQSKWIRLRDTGTEVTLTVKQIIHDGIDGVIEHEITIDNDTALPPLGAFDTTNRILGMLGFTPKAYQENQRRSFTLDGARLEVDIWPGIPPYLEIEADSKDEVIRVAKLLGYDETDLTSVNTTKVYARYGIDLTTITDLRF